MKKIFDLFDNGILSVLFWGLLAVALVAVVWRADFVFGDEQIFLDTLCKGNPVPLSVFLGAGRFTPFVHWDGNWILSLPAHWRAGHVPQLLACANAVLFLLANLMMVRVLRSVREKGLLERVVLSAVWLNFLFAPSVLLVFCWNIFPESRMLLLLAIFLLGAWLAWERDSRAGCAGAFLASLVLLGYKETSFVLLGTFSGTCLLGGWSRMKPRCRILFCLVMALCLLFVAFYFLFVAGRDGNSYQDDFKVGLVPAALFYLRQPEIAIAFVLLAARVPFFLRGRSGRHLFWDALLFAGTAFVLAYMVLQLTSAFNYYQVPAYAFFYPAFLYWLLGLLRRQRSGIFAVLGLLIGLLAYNAPRTCPAIAAHLERRRVEMPALRAIAARKDVTRICYCQPTDGLSPDYQRKVFEKCLEYAGCPLRVERISEFRDDLRPDEVEIAPSGLYDSLKRCTIGTSWYSIYMRAQPVPCGPKGLVLEAHDGRIEGLYSKDSCWAGQTVKVRLALDSSVRGKSLSVLLTAGAVTTAKHPENALTLAVDGTRIGSGRNVWPMREISFTIPAERTDKPVIDLSIDADHAIRPADEGLGSDTRLLGICFASLKILPADAH